MYGVCISPSLQLPWLGVVVAFRVQSVDQIDLFKIIYIWQEYFKQYNWEQKR